MKVTRRNFIRSSMAVTAAFAGLRSVGDALAEGVNGAVDAGATSGGGGVGFGPIVADPQKVLSLPEGFSYRVISQMGRVMEDGLRVPGQPDGMAAFEGPDGKVVLVCNHELWNLPYSRGPYGWTNELLSKVDPATMYDPGVDGHVPLGGTTNLLYNPDTQEVERQYMSLLGVVRNCAGGPTPWNSWITCEEGVVSANTQYDKNHGWNFEVPATLDGKPADPIPLKAMGRFNHEAIAVDPETGIVYQTEDRHEGLIYRFIPNIPGKLAEGGRLQALVVRDRPSCDTRNWADPGHSVPKEILAQEGGAGALTAESLADAMGSDYIEPGTVFDVDWMDLDDIESPEDDLRYRGFDAGAARFARGEGMWFGNDAVYFACTNGGPVKLGQIWRYVPSRFEGQPLEKRFPGRLELFIEPNNHELVKNADNLTVSPWGDLIICEDASGTCNMVGVTPAGEVYRFAEHKATGSEFAGACFSPDGQTLFCNIQSVGITLAITGPWPAAV